MSIYYHLVLISFEYCLRYEMGCECVLPCDGVCPVRPDVSVILYSSEHVISNKYVPPSVALDILDALGSYILTYLNN